MTVTPGEVFDGLLTSPWESKPFMPIVRMIAEGVGPFDELNLDLSDGKGNPHLGPHILAGVNGSGKSTALRALAWALDKGECGFPRREWLHSVSGRAQSRSLVVCRRTDNEDVVRVVTTEIHEKWKDDTERWVRNYLKGTLPDGVKLEALPQPRKSLWAMDRLVMEGLVVERDVSLRAGVPEIREMDGTFRWISLSVGGKTDIDGFVDFAAYAPSRVLSFIDRPDQTKLPEDPKKNCLSFQATVDNEAIHAWLLSIYSKRAIARERKQATEEYTRSIGLFENALRLVYGADVSFDVEIEPRLQPRIRRGSQTLNFSQLPDGIRTGVAWIADFLMRGDLTNWEPGLKGKRPGILLLDEVDTHLHPRWQRTLLPAMREALPDVQIIVTSHSPFVISSCPGARIHVLEIDTKGKAHVRPPEDAPVGQSVTATLKDIFGVPSEFDVETERQLEEWNELVKIEAAGKLSRKQKTELRKLANTLSAKGEELRFMVESPPKLSQSLAKSLTGSLGNSGNGGASQKPPRRSKPKKAVAK